MHYEVVVGNIGTVCTTNNYDVAYRAYFEYQNLSKENYGRCAGENVLLMDCGEIKYEYVGTNEKEIWSEARNMDYDEPMK